MAAARFEKYPLDPGSRMARDRADFDAVLSEAAHNLEDPSSAPTRSGGEEVAVYQLAAHESGERVAELEARIDSYDRYVHELYRSLERATDTNDRADIEMAIHRKEVQRAETVRELQQQQRAERDARIREASLLGIFEGAAGTAQEILPPDFIAAQSALFSGLLDPDRHTTLAQSDWIQDPITREALLEYVTRHTPSFAVLQEDLFRECEQRYPRLNLHERSAYIRRMLPLYLGRLAHELDQILQAITQADPRAFTAEAYEQAAELMMRRLDRVGGDRPGAVLWAPLPLMNSEAEPLFALLLHHQRAGGSTETRRRLLNRFEDLVKEAVARNETTHSVAITVLNHYRRLVP